MSLRTQGYVTQVRGMGIGRRISRTTGMKKRSNRPQVLGNYEEKDETRSK